MGQVVDIVVKSSKTPISAGKSSGRRSSTEFYMTRADIERDRGWVILAEARDSLILLTTLTPSFLVLRLIGRQEWLEMPAVQLTTTTLNTLAGHMNAPPASPGRPEVLVRDVTEGGRLREVRERIRRELGE